ncbi:MAG: hypothetical protein AB1505_27445 [Candidatus Latescibacterota bacterium]
MRQGLMENSPQGTTDVFGAGGSVSGRLIQTSVGSGNTPGGAPHETLGMGGIGAIQHLVALRLHLGRLAEVHHGRRQQP